MSSFLHWLRRAFAALALVIGMLIGAPVSGALRHVKFDATGLNNGQTWTNAYTKLQDAINDVNATEIWIAGGIYRPDQGAGYTPNDRDASFVLEKDMVIRGNFAGSETLLSQRTMNVANQTVLTGEINTSSLADNSHHVVKVSHSGTPLMTPLNTLLDGVTIVYGFNGTPNGQGDNLGGAGVFCNTGGSAMFRRCTIAYNRTISANDGGSPYGAGVRVSNASPVFIDCVIRDNQTGAPSAYGGGIAVQNAPDPQFIACRISRNISGHGAGIAIKNSANAQLINCVISDNDIVTGSDNEHWGGGVSVDRSGSVHISGCTIYKNTAVKGGGYVQYENGSTFNSLIENTIFWGNTASNEGPQIHLTDPSSQLVVRYSDVQGGSALISDNVPINYGTSNNENVNPQFAFEDASANDAHNLRLRCGSPVRNDGDNAVVPCDQWDADQDGNDCTDNPPQPTSDRDLNSRIVATTVDMGAYESREATCAGDINMDLVVNTEDLLLVIGAWGSCADPNNCPADVHPVPTAFCGSYGNDTVNTSDLLVIIGGWGPCPESTLEDSTGILLESAEDCMEAASLEFEAYSEEWDNFVEKCIDGLRAAGLIP